MHTWHLASDTVHLSYGLKLGYMIPGCWTRLASQNKMYLQIGCIADSMYMVYTISIY